MKTAAVIPVKNLNNAKCRLSARLDAAQRRDLCLGMLFDMLDCLQRSSEIADIFLVTGDSEVRAAVEAAFSRVRLLERDCTLNEAFCYAARELIARGVERMLFLHGDLPLMTGEDIALLLRAAPNPGVLLLADKDHRGTNGIAVTPPDALRAAAFGEDSLHRHRQLCADGNIPATIFYNEALSFDVDREEDLGRLAQAGAALQSVQVIRRVLGERRRAE